MEAPLLLQEPGNANLFKEAAVESKKLWKIAGPVIFTTICQYSLGAITQTFMGHVGTLELAAVSVENSVIAGFSFGIMVKLAIVLLSNTKRNHKILSLYTLGSVIVVVVVVTTVVVVIIIIIIIFFLIFLSSFSSSSWLFLSSHLRAMEETAVQTNK